MIKEDTYFTGATSSQYNSVQAKYKNKFLRNSTIQDYFMSLIAKNQILHDERFYKFLQLIEDRD